MKKLLAIFALTVSTLLAQQGGIGPDWSSVDAPQGNFTELNSSSGTIVADSVTSPSINSTGTVSAVTLQGDALSINGTNKFAAGPMWVLWDLNSHWGRMWNLAHGTNSSGAESNRWQLEIPNAIQGSLGLDVLAWSSAGSNLNDSATYFFQRTNGGSLEITSSNSVNNLTNNVIRTSANAIYLSSWAPASDGMSMNASWWWMTNSILDPSWAPYAEWDFEEAGNPSYSLSGTVSVDFDDTSDPLEGSESMLFWGTNATTYAYAPAGTAANEMWVAGLAQLSDNPLAEVTWMGLYTAGGGSRARVQIATDRTVKAWCTVTGAGTPACAEAIPTNAPIAWMLYWRNNTNSTGGVWAYTSTSAAAGWGTPSYVTNTSVEQVARWGISQGTSNEGIEILLDSVKTAYEEIPIDEFSAILP